jgi:ketosteroid isomerase-like protein
MLGTIALCLLLGIAGAVVPGVQADKDQEVEREIKALELHLALLLVRGELDTYSTFLSQDYTRSNDRGEVQSREQVLEQFRTSRAGFTMEPTELVVQSYGDTAILTGLLKVKAAAPSSPERTSRFRKVFVRRSGRWYLVSLQGVPYTPSEAGRPTTR